MNQCQNMYFFIKEQLCQNVWQLIKIEGDPFDLLPPCILEAFRVKSYYASKWYEKIAPPMKKLKKESYKRKPAKAEAFFSLGLAP